MKIAYLIPAFLRTDAYDRSIKTRCAGRKVVLRAYFERPFLESGNDERIAVILANPATPQDTQEKQANVSRWGGDPTRGAAVPITKNEMTADNFPDGEAPVQYTLPNGDKVLAKVCNLEYSHDRRLWFTDIHIDTQSTNVPFVRLALARWQPCGITSDYDVRCSQVVMADFMQVAEDRWVSIHKLPHGQYKLTVSGAFPNDGGNNPFSLTLYKRWFAMDSDMGWRKTCCAQPCEFKFDGRSSNGRGSWSVVVTPPSSVLLTRFRVHIEEWAYPPDTSAGDGAHEKSCVNSFCRSPKMLSMFVELPQWTTAD